MQIIPGRHDPTFGYEASGIVRRVGPKVTKLRVGDRAVVVGSNMFTTAATDREVHYEKLPDDISFVEGACIPLIFMTAVYGLIDLAHLSKGQVSTSRLCIRFLHHTNHLVDCPYSQWCWWSGTGCYPGSPYGRSRDLHHRRQ